MNIYFAGSYSMSKNPEFVRLIKNRLTAFPLTSKNQILSYKNEIKKPGDQLIIDSGAFSVWNKGGSIDIQDYISYCKENFDWCDYFVNLDVIPGKPFQKNKTSDIKEAAKAGWKNYRIMSDSLPKEKIIHVFHQGEEFKWLEKMVDKIPYIGLSPANDKNTKQRIEWLDRCMKYVTDSNGKPVVKFHGFAVTSSRIIAKYPWYSVDSATYLRAGAYGDIYIPKFKNKIPDYSQTQERISVSEKTVFKKIEKIYNKDHFQNLSPIRKLRVKKYIEDKGYSIEKLSNDFLTRIKFNIEFYLDLEKSRPKWPWSMKELKRKLF